MTAKRTGAKIKAGESTYTELGVELGLLGPARVRRLELRPRCASPSVASPGSAPSLVAVLALGIQTDVIGVHWLAFVVWALAGERA